MIPRETGINHMNRVEYLRSQIERAKRFAATLTNIGDRDKFQTAADDYQRELDSLSSADTTSADTSAPSDAIAASNDEAITSTN